MASLKKIQKHIPSADTVAGRVIAFHEDKHYDLGQYLGDGQVLLSADGEKLVNAFPTEKAAVKAEKKTDKKPEGADPVEA